MATKQTKTRKASSKELSDHIIGETAATELSPVDNKEKDVQWDVKQGEIHSDTNLEADTGWGQEVIVRSFEFKANPEAFRQHTPSKQELFNAHLKQIEILLWRDGLRFFDGVTPQLSIAKKQEGYRIVVGCEAMPGHIIHARDKERFQTLSQAANDTRTN